MKKSLVLFNILSGVSVAFLVSLTAISLTVPSQAARLSSQLKTPVQSMLDESPKIGDFVRLPKKDVFGRPITHRENQLVVSMPSCQSCTIKHIDLLVLAEMSKEPMVLVFPEAIPEKWNDALKSDHFRAVVEAGTHIIPNCMHFYTPNCAWVGKNGQIIKFQGQLDADGLQPGRHA